MADIRVTAGFEAGSVELVSAARADDIRVRMRPDPISGETHWFYFRVSGVEGQDCRITLENSVRMARLDGREEVPDCWTGYRPFASYDAETWFRCGAEYEGGIFSIRIRPERDTVYFAYFPPFDMARHRALIARALRDARVRLEVLGQTPGGLDLEMLRIGTPGPGKLKAWIMGRQHPSETMAGFFAEGFLGRLLDPDDAQAQWLLDRFEFFVIPTVNPDGCAHGRTRTNLRAMNLNRAWADPDPTKAPEVKLIRDRMEAEGVDFCLDAHGDEELPYVFLGGPLEIPSRSDRMRDLFHAFGRAQQRACPAYVLTDPYPGGPPPEADLRMAWNWIAERFGCLSVLLEMPFKDTRHRPGPDGWTPARSADFGRATLDALAAVTADLRP